MARSIECKCTHSFTCGYCCRNAKPWFFTLSDGSVIYDWPLKPIKQSEPEEKES